VTCHPINFGDGGHGFVCTRGKRPIICSACGKRGDLLCDWKVKERRSGTCDKPICASCSHSPAKGKDLCPEHAQEWAARTPA
jgi:hypothetical protein